MEEETQFLLKRASQEARRAIASAHPEAEEAHKELSLRYSAKAVAALSGGDGPAGAEARPGGEPASATSEARQNRLPATPR
jgi:hypothetical protein